jgi:hypothetical protein
MLPKHQKEDLLSSWKEIAAYLGCDKRTCLRWEKKFGLPVHRIGRSLKSRVFAYKDELDRWIKERIDKKTLLQDAFSFSQKIYKSFYLLLAAVVIVALLLYFFALRTSGSNPSDFRIQNSTLIILNERGEEMWRYNTGIEDLCDEKSYRDHFQFKKKSESHSMSLPFLILKDINQDGKIEILFSTQTLSELGEGDLRCFNYKGKLLWKFSAGREMKCGSKIYSADYRIIGFDASDLNNDGKLEIIVSSVQRFQWPCQLVVLNHNGEKLGEYWNSGYISVFVFADLNADARKEIVGGGVNNEYGKACLVVFDSRRIKGSSPQLEPEYTCQELEPGSEMYYILLPRTYVDLEDGYPVEGINEIDILKDNRISVETNLSKIIYKFDYNLALQEHPWSSHGFEIQHRKALAEGKIKSTLNEEYWKKLAKGMLFWDGQSWVSHPTTNLLAKN